MLDKLDLGQTAWDMLVVLFIEQLDRKEISITSLCYASLSPTTTALRWLAQLEQRGMVIRKQSPDDLRVQFAELTDKGEQLVREHFSEFGNL